MLEHAGAPARPQYLWEGGRCPPPLSFFSLSSLGSAGRATGNGALPPVGGAEGSAQKGTSSRGAGEAAELARELRRARQELETVRRHADFNSAAAAKEISRLCAALAAAREANASAEGQVLEQAHALDELRREAAAESSAQGRMGLAAERRAAQAAQRLHESREEHSRAVDESARKLNAARRERNALVAALAGVAEAAMVGSTGGDPSATETIIAEARDAQDAGNEPLPRRRDAWAAFKYGEDERASREGAHAGSNAWRGSDGSRAIAALRAAVQRLHRRRAEARDEREVAQEEAAQLRQVLARVDDEYQSVADRVGDLEARLEVEAKKREVQPPGRTGTLAERVGSVVHCAALLGAAADEADNEKRALVVRLLELEFFSKLQEGLSKEDDEVANPDDGNKAILV